MAMSSPLIAPNDRPGNVKFEKIYNRAKDKDVASVVLRVHGTTLCIGEEAYALTAKEVLDCCEQGCVVWISGGLSRPVFWKDDGDVVTVVCLDNSGSGNTLATKVFTSYQAS